MTAVSARLALAAGALVAALAAVPAQALLSNEAFAAQVRALRAQMAVDPQAVQESALMCAYLPEHRAVEEPRCVALRGHLQAQARAEATRSRTTPLPNLQGSVIGQIAQALGRALLPAAG